MKPIYTTIDFSLHKPEIGDRYIDRGQLYTVTGLSPYVTRDGRNIDLIVWRSLCAECGDEFEAKTPLVARSTSRRCMRHRKPGLSVNKRRRRRN